MIIKPTSQYDWTKTDELYIIPSKVEDGLFIQCVIETPKSSHGRNATLWIPPDWSDQMLLAVRDYGRRKRMNFDDALKRSSIGGNK